MYVSEARKEALSGGLSPSNTSTKLGEVPRSHFTGDDRYLHVVTALKVYIILAKMHFVNLCPAFQVNGQNLLCCLSSNLE